MAKFKRNSEIVVEYFQDIKFFEADDDKVIVLLPEGMKNKRTSIEKNSLKVEFELDGVENLTIVGTLKTPNKIEDVVVLEADDAVKFDV